MDEPRADGRSFENLSWPRNVADRLIWQECQTRELILVTANRNYEGPDSLEEAIRSLNSPVSLPELTIADPDRVLNVHTYAERAAERLLDYLLNIEQHRGAGRLYIP